MNNYELMVIINPDLSEEENEQNIELLEKEIAQNTGTIIKREDMGKKEMAYAIDGHSHGLYLLYSLTMEAKGVKPFEKRIKMLQNILRYLLLKQEKAEEEVING